MKISKTEYEKALQQIEALITSVDDKTPTNDSNLIELIKSSDVVEEYEKVHYPISKPTIGDAPAAMLGM